MNAFDRVAARNFPSVFQAWNRADNLKQEPRVVTEARHDLIFSVPEFYGLRWDHKRIGLAGGFLDTSIRDAREKRRKLLGLNPNLIFIAEIRYRDAPVAYLPKVHPWWRRDAQGKTVKGWEEGEYNELDISNPEFRRHVAAQAKAAVQSGVVDGVMLDWWNDDDDRLALVQAVREDIGDEALILVNPNDRQTPRTAPYINGYFMECTLSRSADDWLRIAETLQWAEKNLREPRINCLETWWHDSREDLHLMRATTALSLTLSNGYCLFSDPNPLPTPDHLHNWYPFWARTLGRPLAAGKWRQDGSSQREFEGGTVVYNPMGNAPIHVEFESGRTSAATGGRSNKHTLSPCDGDLFLK